MAKTIKFENKYVYFGDEKYQHTRGEQYVETYDITGPRYYGSIDLCSLKW